MMKKTNRNSTWHAENGGIAGVVRQALADHRSHRQGVHDAASGAGDARFRFRARIFANTVETRQLAGAVAVDLAFGLRFQWFWSDSKYSIPLSDSYLNDSTCTDSVKKKKNDRNTLVA